MNTNDNRHDPHNEIDHIFKDLLPTRNMAERPEQLARCHRMLDAMLEGGIALCDAGTGIGKTYAYLVAGTVYHRFRAASGLPVRPVLISTSSIALQTAARDEYLPLLSNLLTEDGMITQPLRTVIRKGKSHYVCDDRLERRLDQLDLRKKNWRAGSAQLALRNELDMDEIAHLSGYDREHVCVPQICDCLQETCRYRSFLEKCDSGQYLFQICNHNLLLADAIHRGSGHRPITTGCLCPHCGRGPQAAGGRPPNVRGNSGGRRYPHSKPQPAGRTLPAGCGSSERRRQVLAAKTGPSIRGETFRSLQEDARGRWPRRSGV